MIFTLFGLGNATTYPAFDQASYFDRGLYDVPFHDPARSENVSRIMDGDFSDYARTSYAGKSITADDEKVDNRSEQSFAAESCDMTFTFESVFSPSSINGDAAEHGDEIALESRN